MDENKLEKLKQEKFKIKRCCAFCLHRNFGGIHANQWGTCKKHSYEHKKHSDKKRELSITRFGYCEGFELDETEAGHILGLFLEFLE